MMYLPDTCIWIEWIVEGKLATDISSYFKNIKHLVIPTIVQYELYRWVCREKDSAAAMEIIAITEQGTVVPLTNTIAIYAAEISAEKNLAMADAIIYATSQSYQVKLITCDKHFENFSHVHYLPKKEHYGKSHH